MVDTGEGRGWGFNGTELQLGKGESSGGLLCSSVSTVDTTALCTEEQSGWYILGYVFINTFKKYTVKGRTMPGPASQSFSFLGVGAGYLLF